MPKQISFVEDPFGQYGNIMIIYKPIFDLENKQIGVIAFELAVEDFLRKLIDSSLLTPDQTE